MKDLGLKRRIRIKVKSPKVKKTITTKVDNDICEYDRAIFSSRNMALDQDQIIYDENQIQKVSSVEKIGPA